MVVKTKYRKFATGGAVDTEAPTPEPIAELDPSVALRNQIDALRRSERAALEQNIAIEEERQRAAQVAQPTRPAANTERARYLDMDAHLAEALDKTDLPESGKKWLLAHPRFVLNADDNRRIAQLHDILVRDDGLEPYGPEYFRAIEDRLLKPPASDGVDTDAVAKVLAEARQGGGEVYEGANSRIVLDAPRERRMGGASPERVNDTAAGRYWSGESTDPRRVSITLSREQKESARISGISELEYSKQLIRLKQEKEAGNYSGGQ